MMIEQVLQNEAMLKENFNQLVGARALTTVPTATLLASFASFPTTHSFGFEQRINIDGDNLLQYTVYPYRKILLEDRALLSDFCRTTKNKSPQTRSMVKARNFGLNKFVFCHLGAHEYYYSQYAGSNVPAFGVFVSFEIDKQPNANATLYDLESSLVGQLTPEQITLQTKYARVFTAYEVAHECSHDFFVYWICQNYDQREYHAANSWERKREFHYYERVGLSEITAVIWPIEKEFDNSANMFVVRPGIIDEIATFKRFNKVPVFTYEWNEPEGRKRFAYASYLLTESLLNRSQLPNETQFSTEFLKRFASW